MGTTNTLPTVELAGQAISKLIVGCNPFKGNSHLSKAMDDAMAAYYTEAQIVEVMLRCQQAGMQTMQLRGDEHIFGCVQEYRRQGGTMEWICQTASEWDDVDENIRRIADEGSMAIYHHGTNTDQQWQTGTMDVVLRRLELIRSLGLPVGIASHDPVILTWVREEGWPVDFWMCSLYNLSRAKRESKVVSGKFVNENDLFGPEDPAKMVAFIQSTKGLCLAYKILAAGRQCESQEAVRDAFAYALGNIKPDDAVIVGMYPEHEDQIALNCGYVRELCC